MIIFLYVCVSCVCIDTSNRMRCLCKKKKLIINQNFNFMKKFTLLLSMLVAFVATAVAQEEAPMKAITSPDDIQSGKIYWFASKWMEQYTYNTIFWPSSSDDENEKEMIWSSYNKVENDATDPNQQFSFIKNGDDFYLYSVGAQKFVTWYNDGAWLLDYPTHTITVGTNNVGDAAYPWTLAFDGKLLIADFPQTGYEYSGYLYCSGENLANEVYAWQIYEVGELENTAEIEQELVDALATGALEREETLLAFDGMLNEANALLEEINYRAIGGGSIALQTTDQAADNYIWCNEPELSEGPIANLVDGVTGTVADQNFFHSCWNNTTQTVHWLQVELGTALKDFSFAYHTRVFDGSSDFPDVIEVQGSNDDGATFEKIATFDKLPQMPNTAWESGDINADKAYSTLRFVVTAERIYFHMSEFSINVLPNETMNEVYAPYTKYVREFVNLYKDAEKMYEQNESNVVNKTAEIEDMMIKLGDLMDIINGLVSGKEDPKTLEAIEEHEALYALEGVGYPTEVSRVGYKAVIDAAKENPTTQARLDLEEAKAKYLESTDITMPEDGVEYTLTFITYNGLRNYIEYLPDVPGLQMVRDTLTSEGLSYPVEAVFTCEDNKDGSYSFKTFDGKYLAYPGNAQSGSAAGISESKVSVTIEKILPNAKCESDVTISTLFSYVALNFGGSYMAPNSSATQFFYGALPHFMASWTSAMKIEEWTPESTAIEEVVTESADNDAIYDLMGRRVENPVKGVYIIGGKKVLVK